MWWIPRGIAGQDFVLCGALGETIKNHRDRNSGSRRTDLTTADMWATAEKLLPRHHAFSLRAQRTDVEPMG
jgi:hypothetical protein